MAPTMKWDGEADAKLFGLMLHIFDIKLTREALQRLNASMGLDPKSQAITHRVCTARKRGAALLESIGEIDAPGEPIPVTPRGHKNSKKACMPDHCKSEDTSPGSPAPKANKRGKRAAATPKRSYKEPDTEDDEVDEGESPAKKARQAVKQEESAVSDDDQGIGSGFDDCVEEQFEV